MWVVYGIAHWMLKFDSLVPHDCLSHPEEVQAGRHNHIITHSSSTFCIAVRTLLYHSAAISYMSVPGARVMKVLGSEQAQESSSQWLIIGHP